MTLLDSTEPENAVESNRPALTPTVLLALVSVYVIWGSTYLAMRTALAGFPPMLMASAAQMLAGGIVVLVTGLAMGERIPRIPSGAPLYSFFYLVFGGSLIAFTAYTYLLARVRPSLATSYAYVNPVVAVLLGAYLAGENVTAWNICAMTVILSGVATVLLFQPRPD